MANPKPIKLYIKAREAIKEGNKDLATELLTESLGADKPSRFIKNNTGAMLTEDAPEGELALGIVAGEVSRRNSGKRSR